MKQELPLKRLSLQNWIILGFFGCLSSFLMPPSFTLGVIVGGMIVVTNFSLLQHAVTTAFALQILSGSKRRAISRKSYFRLAILGAIIYILLTENWVDPAGLIIGLSILFVSALSLAIRGVLSKSSREAI
jgi:hypothetical protein